MPIEQRTKGTLGTPGPFLAEITNHLDPTYMGSLEVALIQGMPSSIINQSNTFVVKYLNPFYGVTSVRYEGTNSSDFNDVQKSYGMWMVPPDVGTTVMVIFIDGDPNQGYWMGCVQDAYQNHMVPGIAASKQTMLTPEQRKKYGTDYLPVAEFNKKSQSLDNPNVDKIGKPVHPFADRLLAQGLLLDTVRGVTSSSARREVPSSVFGISTPGPIDPNGKKGKVGYQGNRQAPISRLGGSTFVMDDGDIAGQNELIRIRTRTGHQILMHNSQDLIYIANSKGTSWIEMTSNGKLDIYAQDSVSIHTENDFNFRADRDINMEAGRNINLATTDGEMNININTDINTIADNMKTKVSGNYDLAVGADIKVSSVGNINLQSAGTTSCSAAGKFSIASGANISVGANGTLSLGAVGMLKTSGSQIHFNGPAAEAPTAPDIAEQPTPLNLFSVPQRDAAAGWANGTFYKAPNLVTILQRVPSHEPWDSHENINPTQFSSANTDIKITPAVSTANGATITAAPSANTPYSAKKGPGGDRGTLFGQPFSWSTDQPFLTKVKEVSASLQFDPIDLLAIINLESARTFDPAITNNLGYTGLIQFGNDSAVRLGTTTAALRKMARVQQMDYVYDYFHKLWAWPNAKCPVPSIANLYLTVLLPAFRFAASDEKIADATNPLTAAWYNSNKGFDPTHLGYFTPSMVEKTVAIHKTEVQQCLKAANVGADLMVPTSPSTIGTGSGGILSDSSGNPVKSGI